MPMNMPHCRFENTLHALRECKDALGEIDCLSDLSKSETRAALKLVEICADIATAWASELWDSE